MDQSEQQLNEMKSRVWLLTSVPDFQDDPNPEWAKCEITSGKLCNGDWHRRLKIEVFDHDMSGSHDFIGEFETSLDEVRVCVRD